jgi:hypothetical protein
MFGPRTPQGFGHRHQVTRTRSASSSDVPAPRRAISRSVLYSPRRLGHQAQVTTLREGNAPRFEGSLIPSLPVRGHA